MSEMEEFDLDAPVDNSLLFGEEEPEDKTAPEKESIETENEEIKKEEPEDPKEEEKARSAQIPRPRFDEVNSKYQAEKAAREQLEARIVELEAKPTVVQPMSADVAALEREYLAAVIAVALADDDGKAEAEGKAVEIRDKINSALRKEMDESFERKLTAKEQAKAERDQATQFDSTVVSMIAEYPILDSETGNQEAINEVVEWRDFYISKGDAPHIALEKAAKKIAPAYMKDAPVVDTRKADAMKRNAETAKNQPPRPEGVGNRTHSTIENPDNQEDWEKVPDKERKILLQ